MYRASFNVAVHLILNKNDMMLFLRRYNTGFKDGKLTLVAGHLEHGESTTDAIIRETREEVGIFLLEEDLLLSHVSVRNANHGSSYVDFYYTAKYWTGTIINAEPAKCSELIWMNHDSKMDEVIDYIRAVILQINAGKITSYLWMDDEYCLTGIR